MKIKHFRPRRYGKIETLNMIQYVECITHKGFPSYGDTVAVFCKHRKIWLKLSKKTPKVFQGMYTHTL